MEERKERKQEEEIATDRVVPLSLFDLKPISRVRKVDVMDLLDEYRLTRHQIGLLQEQIVDASQNLFENVSRETISTQEIVTLSMRLEIQFARSDILEKVLCKLGQEEIVDQITLFSR
jgi:hypothetical protein